MRNPLRSLVTHWRLLGAAICLLAGIVWWSWDRFGPEVPVPKVLDTLDPEVAALIRDHAEALRRRRGNTTLRRQLGMAYEANDLPQLARLCYRQVLDADPTDVPVWYRYGHVSLELGVLEQAMDAMTRVVEGDPSIAVAWAQRGLWRLDTGDASGADHDFSEALRQDEQCEPARFGLVLLALHHRQPDVAIRRLNELELLDGRNGAYGYHLLGNAYRQLGDVDGVAAVLARSKGLRPDWNDPWAAQVARFKVGAQGRRAQAERLMRAGEHDRALPLLQAASRAQPNNLRISNTLATCLRELGRYDECMTLLMSLHRRAPGDFWTNLNLADTLWLIGTKRSVNLAVALHHADLALEARPDSGSAYIVKGRVLIAMKRKAEAIEVLKRAFEIDARDPSILTQAGFLECDLQRWEQARHTLEQALRYEVRSATPLIGLALAHIGAGSLDTAEQLLEEAQVRRIDHPHQLQRARQKLEAARREAQGEAGST